MDGIYHPQGLAFCGSRFLCLKLIHRPETSRYHPLQKDPVCRPNDNNNNIGWDHLSSGDHCPGFFKLHELLPFQTATSLVNDQANVIPKQLSLNFARECVLQCTGSFARGREKCCWQIRLSQRWGRSKVPIAKTTNKTILLLLEFVTNSQPLF